MSSDDMSSEADELRKALRVNSSTLYTGAPATYILALLHKLNIKSAGFLHINFAFSIEAMDLLFNYNDKFTKIFMRSKLDDTKK